MVGPGNAAKAGDVITIYFTGLGAVQQTVNVGDYGPALSSTMNSVAVSIGGKGAAVKFSGLAPGLVGLYWIQAVVPAGVDPGGQVPVTITSLSTPPVVSPIVTIAVQ